MWYDLSFFEIIHGYNVLYASYTSFKLDSMPMFSIHIQNIIDYHIQFDSSEPIQIQRKLIIIIDFYSMFIISRVGHVSQTLSHPLSNFFFLDKN